MIMTHDDAIRYLLLLIEIREREKKHFKTTKTQIVKSAGEFFFFYLSLSLVLELAQICWFGSRNICIKNEKFFGIEENRIENILN